MNIDPQTIGKTAVLGGGGYIGSHLALALKKIGIDVAVYDSMSVNNVVRTLVDKGEYRDRSLRILENRIDLLRTAGVSLFPTSCDDYHALSRNLDIFKPDRVVHLCALSHATRSNADEHQAFLSTVLTLKNAINYCVGAGVKQLTFNSSSLRYGDFSGPAKEEQHLHPKGYYAVYKVIGEYLLSSAHQVKNLPYTIIVPSALYGPGCISRRVVQSWIENCFDGKPIQIAGNGEERIDFSYIDDVVNGIILTLGNPAALNQTFNISRGEGRSLNELAELLREDFPELEVEHIPWDTAYPSRGGLDISKARDLLGYRPRWALEDGLAEYIAWYRDFLYA